MQRRTHWGLITGLLLFFWLALDSLVMDSPTMDEQNHIGRGLAFVRTGDPRLSMEHPPLVNGLSALPILLLDNVRLPTDDASWQREPLLFFWYDFAEKLFWDYNPDQVQLIVFMARLPIVFLGMGLGLLGWHFGRNLHNPRAGLFAAFFIWFDPNIIAHSRYSTTDLGGTFFLLLALFALWRFYSQPAPSRRAWLALVVALGMAFASKLSILGFVPTFALLALLPLYGKRWTGRLAVTRLIAYLAAGLCSIFVVWVLFAFEWGPMLFIDKPLHGYNQFQGPMPTFWAGIERIAVATGAGRQSYLLGQFSDSGFATYFPVALLVKTPVTTLMLWAVSIIVLLARGSAQRRQTLFLLIPIVLYFSTTTQSGLNIGYRHLLPVLPLLYIMASGLVPSRWRVDGVLNWRIFVLLLAVGGSLTAAFRTHPHYVSYFNELIAANEKVQILADSNIDWGQDLLRLRAWMDDNGVEQVKLSYFGSAEPSRYLNYTPLPGEKRHRDLWWNVPFDRNNPEAGVYAISIHSLLEMPLQPNEKTVYQWFRNQEPTLTIGSLNLYIIE
ncbi:MAG: ArnT family glycosyltransferase [Candidatus Promineifilaceae bacterium]